MTNPLCATLVEGSFQVRTALTELEQLALLGSWPITGVVQTRLDHRAGRPARRHPFEAFRPCPASHEKTAAIAGGARPEPPVSERVAWA
jgi:hypothetical protein